ncbi:hypothetical protein PTSG_05477 [Salpingoeca rosetta]|uniref:BIG2 domain-containing protein n=1 Tax=Salpingoeca rosetta (strain ATCC 50818 / BSB-021) TaxID=946362 RepID=F2UBB7_SALR5|nr:uncharacterized protein PTSG_05477 [Salpingoeca rosetta]EGD73783.1 hypothetical protein PTSG_05477 [Salpingoeca rosetta]|eukprot:XP_004993346.1 hypothetical protein PTSG_05477 [Salpingoeca rosetta]
MRFAPLAAVVLVALLAAVTTSVAALHQYRLSDPRLLLPYPTKSAVVQHNISATGGCFVWSTTRPHVISVTTPSQKCSTWATVEVIARPGPRMSADIIAREVSSDQKLFCEVTVAQLHDVLLETTDHTMYLGDPPLKITVSAQDSEENTFSALSSLPFTWKILDATCKPSSSASSRLRFVTFNEVKYDARPEITALESQGLRGYEVLVQPSHSGRVCVLVSFQSNDYIVEAKAIVAIVERININPPDMYTVAGETSSFAITTQQGQHISLKSGKYSLQSENTSVAEVVPGTSRVKSLAHGVAKLYIRDKDGLMDASTGANAFVHVVEPTKLRISIRSCNDDLLETPCVLLVNTDYTTTLILTDDSNNHIHTDELVFSLSSNAPAVALKDSTTNNTWHRAHTAVVGTADLSAAYFGPDTTAGAASGTPVLTAQRVVRVVDPIVVTPDRVVIPWSDESSNPVSIQLKATGGSGSYLWSSDASRVAHVSEGRVVPVGFGAATIAAYDRLQSEIAGYASVDVVYPSALRFVPGPRDAAIGSDITLHVEFLDDEGNVFDRCSHLVPTWSLSSAAFVKRDTKCGDARCACIVLRASQPERATITVTWDKLSATADLSAHRRLAIHPDDKDVLVSPGAAHTIRFTGGPRPFPPLLSLHTRDLVPASEDAVGVSGQGDAATTAFTVTCVKTGCQTLTVRVGNQPSSAHPYFGVMEEDTAQFCCERPSHVVARLDFDLEDVAENPACSHQDSVYLVLAGKECPVYVQPFFNSRTYNNASTIEYSWTNTASDMAIAPTTAHTAVTPSGSARAKVQVSTKGHRDQRVSSHLFLEPRPAITTSPARVVLADVRDARVSVPVVGGSGVFKVHNTTRVVAARVANTTLVVDGKAKGSGKLKVEDECLLPRTVSTQVAVEVVPAHHFTANIQNKLQVGASTTAELCLFDKQGRSMPASAYPLVVFAEEEDDTHVQLRPIGPADTTSNTGRGGNGGCGGWLFQVEGVETGLAKVRFSAAIQPLHGAAYTLSSGNYTIEVFDALRLSPRRLLLLPGSCFQVEVQNKPTYGHVSVRFHTDNSNYASVSTHGLVCGRTVGETSLTATVFGEDPTVALSTDTVLVKVVLATGLHIRFPSRYMVVGSVVEAYATLRHGDEDILSGQSIASMTWTSDDPTVLSTHSLFRHEGEDTEEFYAAAVAHAEGVVRVTVSAPCASAYCRAPSSTIAASFDLTVFSRLRLPAGPDFIVPTSARFQLPVSFSHKRDVQYELFAASPAPSGPVRSTIAPDGTITTADEREDVVVAVMHVVDGVVLQRAAASLHVDRVRHLSLEPEPSCHHLTLGSHCIIRVVLQDMTGRPLVYTDGIDVQAFVDKSVARVRMHSSNELIVTATGKGEALLRVSVHNSPVSNYFRVLVTSQLNPSDVTVPVGSSFCFPPSEASRNATWASSSPAVATVKPPGHVTIHSEGETEISRTTAQGIAKGSLRSRPIAAARFVAQPAFITNLEASNAFSLRLSYHSRSGANFSLIPACQGKGFQPMAKVTCAAEGHPHLSVAPAFDAASGKHACQITVSSNDVLSASPLVVTATVSPLATSSSSSSSTAVVARTAVTAAPAFHVESSVVSLGSRLASAATLRVRQVLDLSQLGVEVDSNSLLPDAGSTSDRQYFTSASLRITFVMQAQAEAVVTVERMIASAREHTLVVFNKYTQQRHAVSVAVLDEPEPEAPPTRAPPAATSDQHGVITMDQSTGAAPSTPSPPDNSWPLWVYVVLFFLFCIILLLVLHLPSIPPRDPNQSLYVGPQSPQRGAFSRFGSPLQLVSRIPRTSAMTRATPTKLGKTTTAAPATTTAGAGVVRPTMTTPTRDRRLQARSSRFS